MSYLTACLVCVARCICCPVLHLLAFVPFLSVSVYRLRLSLRVAPPSPCSVVPSCVSFFVCAFVCTCVLCLCVDVCRCVFMNAYVYDNIAVLTCLHFYTHISRVFCVCERVCVHPCVLLCVLPVLCVSDPLSVCFHAHPQNNAFYFIFPNGNRTQPYTTVHNITPERSLLYYNSLFGATILTLAVLCIPGESDRIVSYRSWRDPTFLALYACTSFMGKWRLRCDWYRVLYGWKHRVSCIMTMCVHVLHHCTQNVPSYRTRVRYESSEIDQGSHHRLVNIPSPPPPICKMIITLRTDQS